MPDVMILNPWDSQGNRISDSDGVFQCVRSGKFSGYPQGYILHRAYAIQMDGKNKSDVTIDQTPTLTIPDKQSKVMAVVTENLVEGGGWQCMRTTPTIPDIPGRSKSHKLYLNCLVPAATTLRSS